MSDENNWSPFERPFRTGGVTAGAPGAAKVRVRGVEVVQSVQDLEHSVPLIARKSTLVRVYLDAAGLPQPAEVTGELTWRRGTGGANYLPAINRIRLDPARADTDLELRHDLEASLNFCLPPEATAAGELQLALNRLYSSGGPDLAISNMAPATLAVTFVSAPVLRVRAIGLRYRVPGVGQPRTVTPNAEHFAYFRSFLARAYPTAELEWSQIVVDANFEAPFDSNTPVLANAQIAAIRSREVSSGIDPRTHYYGLVDDDSGNNFMRGLAFDIPGTARPDTVASGPVGVPGGYAGDQDRSYADWYGAHELSHTFGRYHPGFPPYDPATGRGQDKSDKDFPYKAGLISPDDGRFVGVDVGDPELGLPMRVLRGDQCHDVMTYENNQWVCDYTFKAILERLRAEEPLGPPQS